MLPRSGQAHAIKREAFQRTRMSKAKLTGESRDLLQARQQGATNEVPPSPGAEPRAVSAKGAAARRGTAASP